MWRGPIGAIAAVAALVLLATPFFWPMIQPHQPEHSMADVGEILPTVESQSYMSGIGELKTVTLNDGTRIFLAASSAVEIVYSASVRRIKLLRGSAFFEVAHEKDRPLLVDAGASEVMVLGTTFGVRVGPNDIQVTVSSGRVSIAKDRGDKVDSHQTIVSIDAGKHVVADLQGEILSVSEADFEVALAWLQGQLTYDGATLADVVADINRYRAKRLEIADPALSKLKVTASFRVDQADRFLASLPSAYPVSIRELPDQTRIEAQPR
jgi:transmembrane sensor